MLNSKTFCCLAASLVMVLSSTLCLASPKLNNALKLCAANSGVGCNELGSIYANGAIVKKNFVEAKKAYQKSCDEKYSRGCFNLGKIYQTILKDDSNAYATFKKSCDLGSSSGCNRAGIIKLNQKDFHQAYRYYLKSCDKNNKYGCENLADLYANGLVVNKDKYKAFNLYKKSCSLNNSDSCMTLGNMYLIKGDTEKTSLVKAILSYKKACGLGNQNACYRIARWYYMGSKTIQPQYTKALSLFKKSCDAKYAKSCNYLALMNLKGEGTPKNISKTLYFYNKACSYGDTMGCDNLPSKLLSNKNISDITGINLKAIEYINYYISYLPGWAYLIFNILTMMWFLLTIKSGVGTLGYKKKYYFFNSLAPTTTLLITFYAFALFGNTGNFLWFLVIIVGSSLFIGNNVRLGARPQNNKAIK